MMNFNQFGLKNELVKAVAQLGFTEPSPIQQNTIPLLINETTDIIALAQTGTGKTAAFGLPLLHKLNTKPKGVQALILSPTRELCMQIKDEMVKYSAFMDGVSIAAVYGGASISEQIRQIKKGVDIVVATPGRLIDLIDRRALFLDEVVTIVLDEADEMLNMGFREDIDRVLEVTKSREEVWLFSATMNNDVRRIAKKFMSAPKEVAVARENVGNENISHQYYVIQGKYRYEALQRLLDITPDIYGIIFTRTKQDAHEVSEKLVKDGYKVSALHGDLDQNMRSKVMAKFKNKQLQVIVATDVAARGIDVNDITHVINYELPDDPEVYTHRSGRTARAGKTGICISISTPREISKIRRIERIVSSKFEKKEIPSGEDVIEIKILGFVNELRNAEPDGAFTKKYASLIQEELEDLSQDDLINKLLWMQLNPSINGYKSAHNLNVNVKETERKATSSDGSVRLFINLGKKDGLSNKKLADFIADSIDFDYKSIDRVTVTELSSYFNVPSDTVDYIMDNLSQQKYNGRKIRVDQAEDKPARRRGDRNEYGGSRSGSDRDRGGYKGRSREGGGARSDNRRKSERKDSGYGASRTKK